MLRVALLLALVASACGPGPAQPAGFGVRPDLLLITIDTLRADRLGRGLTPHLDALAARGVQFTHARATAPLTLPSHVSMLTGTLPPQHGVRENGVHAFTGTPTSVARRLKDAGYGTAAFVGAYVLDRRFGLSDGFEHYDDQIARDDSAVLRLEAERPANVVVDRAVAWVRSHPGGPLFLWVHFYDPHAPYAGSYDREVTFADEQAGRLLRELQALGRRPAVIVAGDHGESLGDHGEPTHGMLLYDAALRVPLIVSAPGVTPARRNDPVSLVDVMPTLLAIGGVAPPNAGGSSHARSLLDQPADGREIYAETQYPRVAGWSPGAVLLQDRWKLVRGGSVELYDLDTDPAEARNLADSRQPLVSAMGARLEALRSATPQAASPTAAPDVAERLRALGYVASSAAPIRPDAPGAAAHIHAWAEFEHALALLQTDATAATARLRPLADKYPDAPVFQSTYARALSESGATSRALEIYRRAVARWPDDAVLYHELAVAARQAGRLDEAIRAERAALTLQPSLPSAHNGLGLLMTDAGRHADAAAAFERATQADPTNAEYWVNLGNARRAAGRVADAASAYRRAAELDPRSADAANGLGVLLVQERRAADAVPFFEQAIAAAPNLMEARLNLGIALQESGQRDRAIAAYRDVIARAQPGSREQRAAADLLRSLGR